MTSRKRRRLAFAGAGLLAFAAAAALVLSALEEDIVFFFSPSDVAAAPPPPDRMIRVGGLVEAGSVARIQGSVDVAFSVSDGAEALQIVYSGQLPSLFREGQGVVAQGRLRPDGVFEAREVLAKHDETYMPPEVADALKRSGHWQDGAPAPTPGSASGAGYDG